MPDIFDSSYDNVKIEISANKIKKGEEINLTAKDQTMRNILIGAGWDQNAFDTDPLDIDLSCFLIDRHGKTKVNEDFVFYNNSEGSNGAVVHNGDSRSGAGEGDDESISIDLQGVSFDVFRIVFVLSIYQGEEREQSLSKLRNSYLRLLNKVNSQEITRYELTKDIENCKDTAIIVASLNREGPKWHFKAIGEPVGGGLGKIATGYDIIVQNQ